MNRTGMLATTRAYLDAKCWPLMQHRRGRQLGTEGGPVVF